MVMRIRDFLARVRDLAYQQLGDAGSRYQSRMRFSFLQLYQDDPAIHFEVWPQKKTGRIEVGLHFEGEREANYRWAEVLSHRMAEIQAQLGPEVELEEWTRAWTRLHQSVLLNALNEELARDTASRLVRLIRVMEPMLAATEPRG